MRGLLLLLILPWVSAQYIIDGSKQERTFDGIGGLSGGGATSVYLPSYPEPYISEILDYLFLPNFGASLDILKVEIGGDCQTTDGTESSHMHTRDDLNFERGYEWWLMKEAKKRNPDILLYGLSWGVPGWIGNGNFYSQDNIYYHIKWLEGAQQVHGLEIDYIGVWNERGYNANWVVEFREQLDASGFNKTKIVAADTDWSIANQMATNSSLKEAVSIVGAHYPGTESTSTAQDLGVPLWASEDYSTYADSTGGGCWARILNNNYVNGYMTSTISWNLIAAYDPNLPYPREGLMWSDNPWTGHYDVQSPIWMTAHTTQFTDPGWIYLAHGQGTGNLANGGSYVTLVPPSNANGDFSLIIETMSRDNSVCIRPYLPEYNVSAQTVTFQLQGGLATNKPLYVWYSHLNQSQENTYFELIKTIKPVNGQFTLSLDVDSVWTVSTLTGQMKGAYPAPPAAQPFPSRYADDFNNYKVGQEAYYFADQTGVWEIYNGTSSAVMRQQVIIPPIAWCNAANRPISIIGDYAQDDVNITIDALIEDTGSVGVGVRVGYGGCTDSYSTGYYFSVDNQGHWNLSAGSTVLQKGTTSFIPNKFYTLTLVANETNICAYINFQEIECVSDKTYAHGWASIGSGWNYAQFDNLRLIKSGEECGISQEIIVMECGTSKNQAWNMSSDGTIHLIGTDDCLTVNGTDPQSHQPSLRSQPCEPNSPAQVFKYNGQTIISAENGNCLDITSASQSTCAQVSTYPCNGNSNQAWYYTDNYISTHLDSFCLTSS